jgi:hypothetical protein
MGSPLLALQGEKRLKTQPANGKTRRVYQKRNHFQKENLPSRFPPSREPFSSWDLCGKSPAKALHSCPFIAFVGCRQGVLWANSAGMDRIGEVSLCFHLDYSVGLPKGDRPWKNWLTNSRGTNKYFIFISAKYAVYTKHEGTPAADCLLPTPPRLLHLRL